MSEQSWKKKIFFGLGGRNFEKNFYIFSLSLSSACSIPVVNFYPPWKLYIFKFAPWPLGTPRPKKFFCNSNSRVLQSPLEKFREMWNYLFNYCDETRTAQLRNTMVTCMCMFRRTLNFFRVGLDPDTRTRQGCKTSVDRNPFYKGQRVASSR